MLLYMDIYIYINMIIIYVYIYIYGNMDPIKSHQYTPFMLALIYQHQPDPSWDIQFSSHHRRDRGDRRRSKGLERLQVTLRFPRLMSPHPMAMSFFLMGK